MKHVRDRPLEHAANARASALIDANERLLARRPSARINEQIDENGRTIDRLPSYTSRLGAEMRAQEQRAAQRQRISAYLYGYDHALDAQAKKSFGIAVPKKDAVGKISSAITGALGRGLGYLDQKVRRLDSDDAAYEAGRRDAERELAPAGRATALLR